MKSEEAIIEALKKTGGNVTLSAKMLGIDGRSLRDRIEKSERLQQVRDYERNTLVDIAEGNVRRALLNGDIDSSWKMLRTLGKKRGYTEKEEVEVSGGLNIIVREKDSKL